MFLRYDKSEQLEFKLEKILGFRDMQEKLEKVLLFLRRKGKYFYTFNHYYSEKSSKRAKWLKYQLLGD